MREIEAKEAERRFAGLLADVEQGETVAITRHGECVAYLAPAHDHKQAERDMAVHRLLVLRRQWAPTGMTLEEVLAARHEGHRF